MPKISGKTKLLGIVGWPVSNSFSPAMHNAAAAELGLDLAYVPLAVRPGELKTALRGLPALGFIGVNVTVPHKQAVVPLLDEIDVAARAIGAVNTIVFDRDHSKSNGSRLVIGYNTDWSGFLTNTTSLGAKIEGQTSIILGAGGAARAVAYGLVSSGSQVHIFARRREQARKLAADLRPFAVNDQLHSYAIEELGRESKRINPTLVINTTPLGMTPNEDLSPWPQELEIPKKALVYDLVYNPPETRLMAQARAVGCQAVNGLGMLVQQGALAFRLWTGHKPDLLVMAAALPNRTGGIGLDGD